MEEQRHPAIYIAIAIGLSLLVLIVSFVVFLLFFNTYTKFDTKGLGAGCVADHLKNTWMIGGDYMPKGLNDTLKEMDQKGRINECFQDCDEQKCTYHGFVKTEVVHPDVDKHVYGETGEIHFSVVFHRKEGVTELKRSGTKEGN